MRQSVLSFGSVLFDELEQVAVRRGGFASLVALGEDVDQAKRGVATSIEFATDANRRVRSVREQSDEASAAAEEVFERIAEAARAVNERGQVVRIRGETAKRVLDKIGPAKTRQQDTAAFPSLVGLWRTVTGLVGTQQDRPNDQTREARIRRRKQQSQIRRQVDTLVDDLKDAQRKLDWQDGQGEEADRDGEAREDPIDPAQAAGDHEDPKGAHRGPGRRERDADRNGKARGGPIDRARAAGDRF